MSMIYKITIENFYSVAEKQEIFFGISKNAPDLPCFKVSRSDENIRLPAVIGFFGSNASGKTTILRTVISSVMFALHSFDWKDEIDLYFQPYRQKEWWGKPTKISIEFESQLSKEAHSAIFRYELHISHHGKEFGNKGVAYEALSYAPSGKFRCLFKRNGQEFYFGRDFGSLTANDPRKNSIRPNASVLSTLTKLNHPLSAYLSRLIRTIKTNFIFNKMNLDASRWLSVYANDSSCLDRLNNELRRFDVGLESMIVEQGNQGLYAKFKHIGLDDFIFLSEESAGTQRFVEIFPRLHYALETGSIAIIDELDTDFHPLLIPELFRWFNDPDRNLHNAQLIFSAHNPAILDYLQKEQVFLLEKPSGKSTNVYGVRDIKGLRREPSLMKKYIAGELGAVPYIG